MHEEEKFFHRQEMLYYLSFQNSVLLHIIVHLSSKMTAKLTELSTSYYDLKGDL